MTATLGVAACVLALAAGDVAFEADLSAAVRATHVELGAQDALEAGSDRTRSTGQLELIPKAVALWESGVRWAAEYSPRLFLPVDIGEGAPELTARDDFERRGEVLHRGELSVERAFRRVRLGTSGNVTYGKTDLLQGGAWTTEPVPTAGRIRILIARAIALASVTPTHRTKLSIQAGFHRSGGADSEALETLPIQRMLLLSGEADWSASRTTRLALGVASAVATTAGTESSYLRASAGWRHQEGRRLTLRAGAGVVASSSSPSDGETVRGLSPWAEAGVERTAKGGRLSQGLAVIVQPGIDPFTGEVQQRAEARGSLSWQPARGWTLSAEAMAAAARVASATFDVGSSNVTSRVAAASVRAERRLEGGGWLALGAWNRWQESSQPGVPSFREWGAQVEASLELTNR